MTRLQYICLSPLFAVVFLVMAILALAVALWARMTGADKPSKMRESVEL